MTNDQKSMEFRVLQYNSLRQEILDIRKRIVPMLGIGLTGIPVFIAAGWELQLKPVIIASPLITVAFIFMLLFEQRSLMRAGRYLRLHIEPYLANEGLIGWENFLEMEPRNRTAERLFSYAALLIFSIYYLIGTVKSYLLLQSFAPIPVSIAVLAFYGTIFFIVLKVVFQNFQVGTKHSMEPTYPLESLIPIYCPIDEKSSEVESEFQSQK